MFMPINIFPPLLYSISNVSSIKEYSGSTIKIGCCLQTKRDWLDVRTRLKTRLSNRTLCADIARITVH